MTIRLPKPLADWLRAASQRHGVQAADIVRRAMRWAARTPYVVNSDFDDMTTYGGAEFRMPGVRTADPGEIRAALVAYLDTHDRAPVPLRLEKPWVAGRDYNVPDAEVCRRFAMDRSEHA